MSQKGTGVKVKIGLQTTANGAGSTATTLNVDDNIFVISGEDMAELVGLGITDGTFTTTIDSITDANTVELAAAQDWADGATITITETAPANQTTASWNISPNLYDDTSKDDAGVTSREASVRTRAFSASANYKNDDAGQVMCIIAILAACKLAFIYENTGGTSDDYSGTCLISRIQLTTPHPSQVVFTADFTTSGAVTGPA